MFASVGGPPAPAAGGAGSRCPWCERRIGGEAGVAVLVDARGRSWHQACVAAALAAVADPIMRLARRQADRQIGR